MNIYLNCPYSQKDFAKQHGARWDAVRKQWYYPGDKLPDELQQFSASASNNSSWGKHGTRYDEDCERCGRCSEVDNSTGLCQSCGSKHRGPQIDTTVSADPYRRGIGQGFGTTDDGDV